MSEGDIAMNKMTAECLIKSFSVRQHIRYVL